MVMMISVVDGFESEVARKVNRSGSVVMEEWIMTFMTSNEFLFRDELFYCVLHYALTRVSD